MRVRVVHNCAVVIAPVLPSIMCLKSTAAFAVAHCHHILYCYCVSIHAVFACCEYSVSGCSVGRM